MLAGESGAGGRLARLACRQAQQRAGRQMRAQLQASLQREQVMHLEAGLRWHQGPQGPAAAVRVVEAAAVSLPLVPADSIVVAQSSHRVRTNWKPREF